MPCRSDALPQRSRAATSLAHAGPGFPRGLLCTDCASLPAHRSGRITARRQKTAEAGPARVRPGAWSRRYLGGGAARGEPDREHLTAELFSLQRRTPPSHGNLETLAYPVSPVCVAGQESMVPEPPGPPEPPGEYRPRAGQQPRSRPAGRCAGGSVSDQCFQERSMSGGALPSASGRPGARSLAANAGAASGIIRTSRDEPPGSGGPTMPRCSNSSMMRAARG